MEISKALLKFMLRTAIARGIEDAEAGRVHALQHVRAKLEQRFEESTAE